MNNFTRRHIRRAESLIIGGLTLLEFKSIHYRTCSNIFVEIIQKKKEKEQSK